MTIQPFGPKEHARYEARHPPVIETDARARAMMDLAPPVRPGYWGNVTFHYRKGKCVTATVTETYASEEK